MVRVKFAMLQAEATLKGEVWTASDERLRAWLQRDLATYDHGPAATSDPEYRFATLAARQYGGEIVEVSYPRDALPSHEPGVIY